MDAEHSNPLCIVNVSSTVYSSGRVMLACASTKGGQTFSGFHSQAPMYYKDSSPKVGDDFYKNCCS